MTVTEIHPAPTFPACPEWCQNKDDARHLAGVEDSQRPDGGWERSHDGGHWSMPGRGVAVAWGGETTPDGALHLAITVDPAPGHELSPGAARRLAFNLLAAADEVEAAQR